MSIVSLTKRSCVGQDQVKDDSAHRRLDVVVQLRSSGRKPTACSMSRISCSSPASEPGHRRQPAFRPADPGPGPRCGRDACSSASHNLVAQIQIVQAARRPSNCDSAAGWECADLACPTRRPAAPLPCRQRWAAKRHLWSRPGVSPSPWSGRSSPGPCPWPGPRSARRWPA